MTEFAVPGKVRLGLPLVLVQWLCVSPCGAEVAITELDVGLERARTWTTQFLPVRVPDADHDGLPFFGPGRRDIRGKSARRHPGKLANQSNWRARSLDAADGGRAWADPDTARRLLDDPEFTLPKTPNDYSPIEAEDFETMCMKCPRRLRIHLASALPGEVSS